MKPYKAWLIFLLLGGPLSVLGQRFPSFESHLFTRGGHSLPYRIQYPLAFDSSLSYPVLVFLHGSEQRGTDNEKPLYIGGRYFQDSTRRAAYPAIVIFPQCPENEVWAYFDVRLDSLTGLAKEWFFPFPNKPTWPTGLLKDLLDSLEQHAWVNTQRIYVGGLSQGGMGVWDLLARYPGYFAAGFPICGAGKPATSKRIAGHSSVWIFHGSADDIVPAEFSRTFYKRLKKAGAEVRYTEYAGVYHNSWVNAFAEPELMSWLFAQRGKGRE